VFIQALFAQSSVVIRRSGLLVAIAISGALLNACSSGFGEALQRSLSADPQLEENADQVGATDLVDLENCPTSLIEQLPENFPTALCYPNSELVETQTSGSSEDSEAEAGTDDVVVQTSWSTSDASIQVVQFYQAQLDEDSWEITNPADVEQALNATSTASDGNETGGTGDDSEDATPADESARDSRNVSDSEVQIEAVKAGDRATIIIFAAKADSSTSESQTNQASETDPDTEVNTELAQEEATTKFTIEWQSSASGDVLSDADADRETGSDESDPNAARLRRLNSSRSNSSRSSSPSDLEFSDLEESPDDLEPFVRDLAKLGILTPASRADGASGSSRTEFDPNAITDRRTYARWLFEANNELYGDRPARKIRAATDADQPVFSDVPKSDPDFGIIQGLAEAGLIPSPLSGTSTQLSFRPDAPITREALLTWKVPLDFRGTLPTATINAIEETWGFQDASRINPNSLKAVLADYQNGDNANVLRAFGYTTLFQPQKTVTRAEAAATLWYFGYQGEGISAREIDGENEE